MYSVTRHIHVQWYVSQLQFDLIRFLANHNVQIIDISQTFRLRQVFSRTPTQTNLHCRSPSLNLGSLLLKFDCYLQPCLEIEVQYDT